VGHGLLDTAGLDPVRALLTSLAIGLLIAPLARQVILPLAAAMAAGAVGLAALWAA
jgi:hypothetical protein